MIESRQAAKVGRSYYAFYRGYQARRTSTPGNPYKAGSDDHTAWNAGWEFAVVEQKEGPQCI